MNVTKLKNLAYVLYWYASYFRSRNKFWGHYREFSAALENVVGGYSSKKLLEHIIMVNRSVLNGEIVQERDGVALANFENSYQVNFYLLLAQSAAKKVPISVLDFGGGLGTTHRQFKFFTQQQIYWTIVEQPQLVAEGRQNFETDELSFTCEIPKKKFNVALFSAVLDVVEDPYSILAQVIVKTSPDLIIIDRSLYHSGCEDYYTIKATAKHITNKHKYPVAWFSMSYFVSKIESMGYKKIDCWATPDGKVVSGFTVGSYHGLAFTREVL